MQYFASKHAVPGRDVGADLKLIYASNVNNLEFTENPRSFHCHHGMLELVLCMSGSCLIIIDGKPYNAAAGDIVIYNSGSYHQECSDQSNDFSLYCVAASGVNIPGLDENCICSHNSPKIVHTADAFPMFKLLFARIYELIRIGNFLDGALIDHYMHALLCELLTLCKAQENNTLFVADTNKASIVEQIYDYLSRNYTEKITLREVGDALSLSPDYISHIFKEASGYAPMQYVNALRIGNAQVKLIETNDKIADIALSVGFNNIGNFNRAFYNFVGDSPRNFRKHHTESK